MVGASPGDLIPYIVGVETLYYKEFLSKYGTVTAMPFRYLYSTPCEKNHHTVPGMGWTLNVWVTICCLKILYGDTSFQKAVKIFSFE